MLKDDHHSTAFLLVSQNNSQSIRPSLVGAIPHNHTEPVAPYCYSHSITGQHGFLCLLAKEKWLADREIATAPNGVDPRSTRYKPAL
ncbi:hypothetical protein [Endozoicomonas sp. ALC066]|uniref:hypothetical protein n=1 Tax=Endozoicomonas sp. ALC066 TaxID=3403078 RepID=UPI003BB489E8